MPRDVRVLQKPAVAESAVAVAALAQHRATSSPTVASRILSGGSATPQVAGTLEEERAPKSGHLP